MTSCKGIFNDYEIEEYVYYNDYENNEYLPFKKWEISRKQ